MQVIYDDEMLDQLDGILSAAGQVLSEARRAMKNDAMAPGTLDLLLQARDEMAMRLARYEAGYWVPDISYDIIDEIEEEATDILVAYGKEDPGWICDAESGMH